MNWAQHIGFSIKCILLIGLQNACTGPDAPECVSALGEIISETRPLDSFSRISIKDRLNVNLVQDTANWIEVEFGQGLTDGIITKVENNTLHISEENSCDWVRDQKVNPELIVHYTNLEEITNLSSGFVFFENHHTNGNLSFIVDDVAGSAVIKYDGDSLWVTAHTGATDIVIEGSTHFAYFYNSSYAPIDAKKLTSDVSIPHSNLTGNIIVNVSERLSYQIFDEGDIIVHGNPTIIEPWAHQGKGQIIIKG